MSVWSPRSWQPGLSNTVEAVLTIDYTQRIVQVNMIGKEFRKHRKRLGLTQVGLANRMGVTANTVARWERGEIPIRESMARLITFLGADLPAKQKRR